MDIYNELISRVNRDNYPGDYDNGFSLAESIAILTKKIKNIDYDLNEKSNIINELKNKDEFIINLIESNKDEIYKITHGLYNSIFKKLLENYINENIDCIFKNINFLSIEINDNGQAIAYIPDDLNKLNLYVNNEGCIVLEEVY